MRRFTTSKRWSSRRRQHETHSQAHRGEGFDDIHDLKGTCIRLAEELQ